MSARVSYKVLVAVILISVIASTAISTLITIAVLNPRLIKVEELASLLRGKEAKIAAIQKEGELIIYGFPFYGEMPTYIRTGFEKYIFDKYGINIHCYLMGASSGENFAKMKSEAGNPTGDLVFMTGAYTWKAMKEGLIEPYVKDIPELKAYADENPFMTDGNYTFVGGPGTCVNGITYASNRVPAPKKWSDLLNPVYDNSVIYMDPSIGTPGLLMILEGAKVMGKDYHTDEGIQAGLDFLKELHKNVYTYYTTGAAEFDLPKAHLANAACGWWWGMPLLDKDDPESGWKFVIPEEGSFVSPGAWYVIPKDCKHPLLAREYVIWILTTPEGSTRGMMGKASWIEIVTSMCIPPKTLWDYIPSNVLAYIPEGYPQRTELIDYEWVAANTARLVSLWNEQIKTLP